MVNICLIGYGKWGKVLLKKLKKITNTLSVLRKKNYSLQKIKLSNWVVIATPDDTHYKIVKDCIKLKKNVLCEKPLVKKTFQAKELYALAKIYKVKLLVSDLSKFYKNKINLSKKINIFKRFKNSDQNIKKHNKRFDLLYRFAYHDIGYIYNNVKLKKIKYIKILCSKKILSFFILFGSTKYFFYYDTIGRKKIYNLNRNSLIQKKDILSEMLRNFIIKGKCSEDNEKKSLFIIKTLEKIRKKINVSKK